MKAPLLIIALLISSAMKAQTLPEVDLRKYEGDWYVIGYKPSALDKNWINTVESYAWDQQKQLFDVVTTYKKKPDGKQKSITQKLLPVANSNNAKWIARIWLFIRADYVIYKIADDYSYVVVGHPKHKYLYIMARKPQMSEALYDELVNFAVSSLGYSRNDIVKHLQESRI